VQTTPSYNFVTQQIRAIDVGRVNHSVGGIFFEILTRASFIRMLA